MGRLRARPCTDGLEPRQAGTLLVLHARVRASVRDAETQVVGERGELGVVPTGPSFVQRCDTDGAWIVSADDDNLERHQERLGVVRQDGRNGSHEGRARER